MAQNVTISVVGGRAQTLTLDTVQEAFEKLELDGSYSATINGETASMDDDLEDYSFVTFAEKVKGGAK